MSDEKTNATASKKGKVLVLLLCVSVALMLIGSAIAEGGLTSFGAVDVEEIQFVNGNGANITALLYVPKNIAAIAPVPAVVACHGYSASNDAQELHAIELSRRGFVVMAIDAYAHGLTQFPNMEFDRPVNDTGMYAALQYLGPPRNCPASVPQRRG